MSWDSYMDTLEGYTGKKMTFGAIYGQDGSRWTSKGDIAPNQDEINALVKICNNCDHDKCEAQTKGVFLGGKKFRFLRHDEEEKCLDFSQTVGDKLQTGNVVLTKQAVLVCVTEEESKNSNAAMSACKLASYLKDTGY